MPDRIGFQPVNEHLFMILHGFWMSCWIFVCKERNVNTKCFLHWFTILNFPKLQTLDKLKHHLCASLTVQWLSLWVSSAGGHSFDPWLGDKYLTCHVVWPETKKTIGHCLHYNLTKYCPLFLENHFPNRHTICVCVYIYIYIYIYIISNG